MKRFGFNPLLLGLLAFLAIRSGLSAETNDLPHFQEVFRLLRANLPGVTEEDLNRAAVQGLLDQFYPRVILVTNGAPAAAGQEDALLTRTTVYNESYGYVRAARVATGLADQIKSAYEKLGGRNKLKGLILDLRFAAGQDYIATPAIQGPLWQSFIQNGKLVEWHFFSDANHGFRHPDNAGFQPYYAELTWPLTTSFLQRTV